MWMIIGTTHGRMTRRVFVLVQQWSLVCVAACRVVTMPLRRALGNHLWSIHLEDNWAKIIESIGEDLQRPGLIDTPKRAAKAFEFLTRGYKQSVDEVVNEALFPSDSSEMILVQDIELYSLCEHHLLPFQGTAHVAYIPDGKVTGLSKIARVVEEVSRKPQVQERMTQTIAQLIDEHLNTQGVAVVCSAEHSCMSIRGIRKPGSFTVTSALRGVFKTDQATRAEFMSLIKG